MKTQIINTVKIVEALIYSLLSLIFCLFAQFVLVYYIRRKYKLHKEINRIPQEMLIIECYRNHLKNLKLKCIINNFIIVILAIEISQNLSQFCNYSPYLIIYFIKEPTFSFSSILEFRRYSALFFVPIYYLPLPVLCMLMDFLWLAYRKYEYKYTIIRWIWYIVVRVLCTFLGYSAYFIIISHDYKDMSNDLLNILCGILSIIDLIQYAYYARKFYLHLKSREKEIRLFYFDKKAYLDSKYLRIHFKIATILVGIAFFFLVLTKSVDLFIILDHMPYYIDIPPQLNDLFSILSYSTMISFLNLCFSILYHYLYLIICIYLLLLFTSHTETDRN